MKTSELLLSSLQITEDEYMYKGSFILSADGKSMQVDMCDFYNLNKIDSIKHGFGLEETNEEIKKIIMEMIMEKASISSKIVEGQGYNE